MAREGTCYRNYTSEYITLAIINTASSSLSLLICLFVIATIILFKKYVLYTQRLALYVCLTAALWNLSTTIGAKQYFPMNDSYSYTAYCVWSGYYFQTTTWMLYASLGVISMDLYVRVVYQKSIARYEWLFVIIIFIFPLFINCIPFIENSYGQAGPWCWIRAVNNDSNCSPHTIGFAFRIAIGYAPIFLVVIVLAILYILMVRHLYKHRYTGLYNAQKKQHQQKMFKEALPFLIYPWPFLVISSISLANRIGSFLVGNDQTKIIGLLGVNAATFPFLGTFAAVIFGIDIETLRRLCQARTYVYSKNTIEEYPVLIPSHTDSFKEDQNTEKSLQTKYMELPNEIQSK